MLNEKYNSDFADWKTRLDELSGFSGENSPVTNTTWEKLDKRLRTKKYRKNTLWYYVAAACLIAGLIIPVFTMKNKEASMLHQMVQQDNKNEKEQLMIQQVISVKIPTDKNEKKQPEIYESDKINTVNKQPLPEIKRSLAELVQSPKDSIKEIAEIVAPAKINPVIFIALKNKLPVVHINDLGKPNPLVEPIVRNNDRPFLRIRLFNRDIFPESTVNNTDQDNNTLKIKLSP